MSNASMSRAAKAAYDKAEFHIEEAMRAIAEMDEEWFKQAVADAEDEKGADPDGDGDVPEHRDFTEEQTAKSAGAILFYGLGYLGRILGNNSVRTDVIYNLSERD
jgi:hypothetical protein